MNIAINGFGRIGRSVFKIAFGRKDVRVVAVNDVADGPTLAHLLQYDSSQGRYGRRVESREGALVVDGVAIPLLREADPSRLPWAKLGVDVVIECSGRMTARADAARHLGAGARRVLISATSPDADATLVLGVNAGEIDPERHFVISNASCTTNCLAPVLLTLRKAFGVARAHITTVHSYTNDQSLLDNPHEDLRKARAGALSMVPIATGAVSSVVQVLPELAGKLSAACIRVPTPSVSLADITLTLQKSATVEEVNRALRMASENILKGILGYTELPLVSADYLGSPFSGVVDGTQTQLVEGTLARVLVWYDNEWGYSNRLVEQAEFIAAKCAQPLQVKTAV